MKRIAFLFLLIIVLFLSSFSAFAEIGRTVEEAVNWVVGLAESNPPWGSYNNVPNYDGSEWTPGDLGEPQCVDLTAAYLDYLGVARIGGDANNYAHTAGPWLPDGLSYRDSASPGDIVVWSDNQHGHVGVVFAVDSNGFYYVDTRGDLNPWTDASGYVHNTGATKRGPSTSATSFIHPDFKKTEVRGSEMTQGFDRAIPDGDYLIATAKTSDKTTFYYLDIEGSARPAANETNVSLWGPLSGDPPIYEIWTVTYNSSDKFYTIKQKGTNMCLDVYGADSLQGKNVQVCASNGSSAQKWAIERNGSSGYRLRPKCSGGGNSPQCLDIAGGNISGGTQVQQWTVNDSDAQSWLFIPYAPSQPIADGRYILLYGGDNSYELDVPGDTGDVLNNTGVIIWSDTAPSQYNSFDFIQLSNGYYKVVHAASGLCLDVTEGKNIYKSTVALHTDNGSIAQQWAVISNGAGYSLVSRCNGYALDLPDGSTGDGKKLEVYPRLTNTNQRWSFVRAEYNIRYTVTEGVGGPADQIKYYKTELKLSSDIPTRSGYKFLSWEDILSLDANLNTTKYYPGDVISKDEDLALYPVWQRVTYDYTITYDANGGIEAPPVQRVITASTTLSSAQPRRAHYSFLGWAKSSSATTAMYQPGDAYNGGVSVTLYAVWRHNLDHVMVLPNALTEIESEAFIGTSTDAFVIPASVTAIGANAFDDVVIYGYSGSYAESYASANGLEFIPITDQWVLEDEVPSGAHVTDEKWTYTLTTTETTTSTATSMTGWTQTGNYTWQQTGTGTRKYANYPSGFDTGSSLYSKYNKSALPTGETIDGNTKRIVDDEDSFETYIYWHWTFVDSLNSSSDNHNVLVEDAKRYGVQTGNVYRDYVYFDAFEDTVDHGTWGPGTSGQINVDPMRYAWRDNLGDVSHWWWIFEVRRQTYTDYEKLFTYIKNNSEILESDTKVVPGDDITNVQRWVKYSF